MKIVDTTWFKVLVILLCVAAYGVLGRCDAIGSEAQTGAPVLGGTNIVMPPQMEVQRGYTPERSLVYHHFDCGNYNVPAWSILMRSNGRYIIGPPRTIHAAPGFVALVYEEFPVQMFHYEPCEVE